MKKITMIAFGLLSISLSAQVPSYVPTSGLVGYWTFDGNGNDLSSSANNLTTNGNVSYSTDRFGNTNSAALFDAANEYFNKMSPVLPSGNSPRSLSLWLNSSGIISNVHGECPFIYGDLLNGGCYKRFGMLIKNSTFIMYVGKCNPAFHTVNNIFSNWHHLVYTFGPGQTFALYQDGVLIQSSVLSGTENTALGELRIGSGLDDQNPVGNVAQFDGKIDEVAFYNRVLTQQEISDLYNGGICYTNITVTDTLLINTSITGFNPVTYKNTIKVWPNPTNDHITIDNGNIANLTGYQIKITNSLSQQVFQSAITQQQFYVDLSTWSGNGIYFVHIIDGQGNTIDIKKIVLQ